jgi:hypothetical protein
MLREPPALLVDYRDEQVLSPAETRGLAGAPGDFRQPRAGYLPDVSVIKVVNNEKFHTRPGPRSAEPLCLWPLAAGLFIPIILVLLWVLVVSVTLLALRPADSHAGG